MTGGGSAGDDLTFNRGIEDRFGVVSHERTLSRLLAAPDFSRLTGRPQYPAQARAKTRASWRLSKNVPQSLASPLTHGPADKPIEIWVQDEARIGQKTGAALMLPWGADTGTRNLPLKEIQPDRCKRRSGGRPDGPRAGAHIRRGEGSEDPDPDLPARQITGAQSGENVWQSLRENGLSNRLLEDQAGLLAAGCDAWIQLMKEPRAIKSSASRDWTQNGQT